jgi:hypothetical protein
MRLALAELASVRREGVVASGPPLALTGSRTLGRLEGVAGPGCKAESNSQTSLARPER